MAYNPYLPFYQQTYQQGINNDRLAYLQGYQQQMPPVVNNAPNQGLIWVQGEAGAKSYIVAPGANVLLMDSESQRFYIKSVDGSGMPTMKVYEYKEVENTTTAPQEIKPETEELKSEIEKLKSEIEKLKEKLEENHEPVIQSTKRKQQKPEYYAEYDERI